MKLFKKTGLVMCGLLTALCSFAQADYTTNWDEQNGTNTKGRYPKSVTVNGTAINWATSTGYALYTDNTATEITVGAGASFNVNVDYNGTWMNAYAYIDEGKDGFSCEVDDATHKPADGSDLKSFSFFSFSSTSEDPGYDSNGTYLTGQARNTLALPAITAPANAGTYRMRVKIDWNNIDPKGATTASLWGSMQANGGAIMDITLKVVASRDVTFNYTDSKTGHTFSFTHNIPIDQTDPTAFLYANEYYSDFTCNPATMDATTNEVNVSCTSNFPFTPTTITDGKFAEDATKWYTMKVRFGDTGRYAVYSNDEEVAATATTRTLDKNNLWAFVQVENSPTHFKIYNLQAGPTKPLGVPAISGGTGRASFITTNPTQEFILTKNSYDGFVFEVPDHPSICLGQHAQNLKGTYNAALGYWNSTASKTDKGSVFAVFGYEDLITDVANATDLVGEEYVGTITSGENAVTTAVATFNGAKTLSNLDALMSAYENFARVEIDNNKFYQLVSYKNNKVAYATPFTAIDGSNTTYGDRELSTDAAPAVAASAFKFGADGSIQHANSNFYLLNLSDVEDGHVADLPIDNPNVPYVLENVRGLANVWTLRTNASTENFLSCDAEGAMYCSKTEPATDDNLLWAIKEIKSLNVTVGAAKWATLCLPFPVVIPNDETLKVYTVTDINDKGTMTLTELEKGQALIAGTPVLLASSSDKESDTYTFALAGADATYADLSGNKLNGTTARRAGFANATGNDGDATGKADSFDAMTTPYYGLGKKDGVGFYPATSNVIAANKAYILKSKVPATGGASKLSFDVVPATGISTVANEENNEPTIYYNLQGQRVLYPSNGVFVTNHGKKVFVR